MFRTMLWLSNFVSGFFCLKKQNISEIFFKNCPVSKQLGIIIFQVKFIQILSGGYYRTDFYHTYSQKLLLNVLKSKQEINQYSDASQNVIVHNIKLNL